MKGYTPRKYVRPPARPAERRVYVLRAELVDRIHAFGQSEQRPSEVDAVRYLLDEELRRRGF